VPPAFVDLISDLRKNIRREIDGKLWCGSFCLMKLHVLVVNYGMRTTDVSRYLGITSVRIAYKKWMPRILNQIAKDNKDTAEQPPSKHPRIIKQAPLCNGTATTQHASKAVMSEATSSAGAATESS
jgi:hypothetical protein